MKRNIIILILMIAFVFVFGTVAFHLIESWSLFDSFFHTHHRFHGGILYS